MNENKKESREEELINLIPEDDRGDVMTLRFVLKSVTEFLRDIKEPLAELMKTLGASLDGKKIGEEVAAFYKSLKEADMPEDLAAKMTQEYFENRMKTAQLLSSFMSKFTGGMMERKGEKRGWSDPKSLGELMKTFMELKKLKEKNETPQGDNEETEE